MRIMSCIVVTLVVLAVVSSSQAGFTNVGSPFFGELSHKQILSGIYGGTFTASGKNFSNGTITATRVEDSPLGSSQGVVGPITGTDQVWHDGFVSASAAARYTLLPCDTFGYYPGESGGSYQKLFDVNGYGFNVKGSSDLIDARGQTWRWGQGSLLGGSHSSKQADNGGNDFLVTYQISGLSDSAKETTWMLFWEDIFGGQCITGDFNDVVVEVKATASLNPVPVPGALVLGALGLGLVGWYQRRRVA
jgi:hypothetical protein